MPTQEELRENLMRFAQVSSTEVKQLRTLVNGNKLTLSSLNTQDKTNLVAAINELLLAIQGHSVSLEQVDEVVQDYFILHPQSFDYDQAIANNVWVITHPLDHRPSVTVIDSAGSIWSGQVSYPASNQVRIEFNIPLAGRAVLT